MSAPNLLLLPSGRSAGKLYSVLPNTGAGDFTVSRNGTATYLDKDGLLKTAAANVPRFKFDPLTGEFRGVLVEPSATNVILRSDDFGQVNWTKQNITVSSNTSETNSPDGTQNADKVTTTTTTGVTYFRRNSVNINNPSVCFIFAKFAGIRYLGITMAGITSSTATYDLVGGTVTQLPATAGFSASIVELPNGWYQCVYIKPATTAGYNFQVNLFTSPTGNIGNTSIIGDGVSGIYAWGAQFEIGTQATSYIATVASEVTRPADVISLTGASALIGQTEGTVYVEANISNYANAAASFITVSDNSINNRIEIRKGSPDSIILERNSSTQSGSTSITLSGQSNGIFKMAVAYQSGNTAFYVNGAQVGTNNTDTFTMSLLTHIYLGSNATGSAQILNDSIKVASIFPTRLSNAELEALTTL